MSATLTGTDKTSGTIRFKNADNSTVDSSDPITIPSSGSICSYSKQVRLYCSATPDQYCDNFQMYSDGSNGWTGVTVLASNYSASLTAGGAFVSNATPIIRTATNIFTYTSGAALNMDAVHTASVNTATGYFGDIVILQMKVKSTASSGQLTSETLTFSYDEV